MPGTIEELSADPTLDAYRDPASGQIQFLKKTDDPTIARERHTRGLLPALPEEVQRRSEYLKNTTLLNQVGAAGMVAARTASMGLVGLSPEQDQQIKDFSKASPTLSTLSKVAGAAAPALLTAGALAPEAAGAAVAGELGTAAAAPTLAATVMEEAAGNLAYERESATEENRDISLGNILVGMGLGAGVTTAGRYAMGAARRTLGTSIDAAASPLASAEAKSGEMRSVGAAAAGDTPRPPASSAEVFSYARSPEEYHAQVNIVGHDALADAFTGHAGVTGESGGAARQVHGLAFKEQDVLPHMTDVDSETAFDALAEHLQAVRGLADTLEGAGQKLAAQRINAISDLAEKALEADPEALAAKAAVGLNNVKRELDDIYGRYLRTKGVTASSAAKEIQKVVEPLRAGLEDSSTWGDFWAARQVGENRLWSGDNGIIQLSNIWQPEVFESVKGRARVRVGDVLSEVMNQTPRANIAEHIMGLPTIKANKVIDAWESTVEQWKRMTELKEESGLVRAAGPDGESVVETLKQSLADQQATIDQLRHLRDVGPRAKPILAKEAAKGSAKGSGEMLFEAVKEIPGIGHTVRAADRAAEAVTGRGIGDRLFSVEPLPPAKEFTRDSARAAIEARNPALKRPPSGGSPPPAPAGPPPMTPAPVPGGSPISLAGKSLEDLNALPLDGEAVNGGMSDRARVEALKADPTFAHTGRVSSNDGARGIVVVQDGPGRLVLRDGRHRLVAAQELGRKTVQGAVVDGETGKEIFRGAIPIAGGAAVLTAGALATRPASAASPTTDTLAKISDNAKAIRERAALGLSVPESAPPPLPAAVLRFQGQASSLEAAYAQKIGGLRAADQNPEALIHALTDSYGEIGQGGHRGLYEQLAMRSQVAVQYLLSNAPPSVGISMTRPDGIPPDFLAVSKWAQMYDAAFNPGNVVHDVGTGNATPTQIKVLKEVHPDVFADLKIDVLKQIAQGGERTPFETLRQLDVLFDTDGAAGPSWGRGMSATLAAARSTPKPPQSSSLGGESSVAPQSAESMFSKGPTSLRAN